MSCIKHPAVSSCMKKYILIACLFSVVSFPVFSEVRTLEALFPALDVKIKDRLAATGIYFNSVKNVSARIKLNPNANIPQLAANDDRFKYVIETLILISGTGSVSLTDIYNATKDLQTLEGRVYYSETRKKNMVLFQDATRIISEKN
ncbi:MAG: hypothetical protein LBC89_02085, partial [Bacteroidales bacterium]|nr:hypothetical protein [Bacteroidales bacterium]